MTPLTVADLTADYDRPIARLIDVYFRENEAARTALALANRAGTRLVIDHITIRCHRVDERVGQSRFRCDLAVRANCHYAVGILVDTGAHYANPDLLER